jgi:DHA1 family tetracycline resistance protein-like MFS transporter
MTTRASSAAAAATAKQSNERALYMLVTSVFFDIFAVALIIPLMPYYAKSLGASAAQQGMIGTIYGFCQFIGAVGAGRLSDRRGRKFVLLLSLAAASISYLGTALAPSLPWLLFWRIPVGLCKQTLSVAFAFIGDASEESRRSLWLGLVGSAAAIGFILGPALGGWLGERQPALPAVVSSALFAVNFVCVWLFLPNPIRETTTTEKATSSQHLSLRETILSEFRTPITGELLVIHFLFHMAFQMMKSNHPLFNAERFGFGPTENGLVLAYVGVLSLIGKGGFVPWLTSKFREMDVFLVGLVLMTSSLIGLALVFDLFAYAAVLAPFTFSTAVIGTIVTSLLTKTSDSGNLGTLLGVASAFESSTRVISPVLCGVLIQWWSGAPPLLAAAVSGVCVLYVRANWSLLNSLATKTKTN